MEEEARRARYIEKERSKYFSQEWYLNDLRAVVIDERAQWRKALQGAPKKPKVSHDITEALNDVEYQRCC